MDVIKHFTRILLITSTIVVGQNPPYPKDTIFVKFEHKPGTKNWNAKFERDFKKNAGVFFNLESKVGDMALFYSYNQRADTLCIQHLKDYHFSDLDEINEKRNKWIFENKRPPANKNGVFQTYLIEVISKEYFVKYPVIWRNEGVVD